ncbi:hypothetical protein [Homoserinibacter sp. GY 40078]|uniref:hypothetical protein n=1 Tax=Homoserinibacter sp. GY 40078 TaxID=2603275 RepID=UPI0011C84BE1|nr:hypothetical protein [Homoserinibacter sp. GY 40078]TXK19050.1 hypothetical protein FVQ89_03735 [Homoserinibacter sp. GY 40078]
MSGGQVFLLCWGVFALGLGSFFAFRPHIPAARYETRVDRFARIRPLRERVAPRKFTVMLFRIGGVVFMIAGLGVFVLALVGVIP